MSDSVQARKRAAMTPQRLRRTGGGGKGREIPSAAPESYAPI
jgi:hypothetical protein